jgi:uncharacterized protein YecT (DUF1311 family)
MKIYFTLVACFGVLLFPLGGSAQTQSKLNTEARAEFAAAEKQLAVIYQKLLETLDSASRQKLAEAQKAWVSYREAQALLEADQVRGGTAAPSILDATRAELTREQIGRLKKMLPGG